MNYSITSLEISRAGNNATSYVTGAFAIPAGVLAIGFVGAHQISGTAVTPTVTQTGATWTQFATVNWNTGYRITSFYARPTTAVASVLATIGFGSDTQSDCTRGFCLLKGAAPGGGANGVGALVAGSAVTTTATSGASATVTHNAQEVGHQRWYLDFHHINPSSAITIASPYTLLGESTGSPSCGVSYLLGGQDTTNAVSWTGSDVNGHMGLEVRTKRSNPIRVIGV